MEIVLFAIATGTILVALGWINDTLRRIEGELRRLAMRDAPQDAWDPRRPSL